MSAVRHSPRTRTDASVAVGFKDQAALMEITRAGYERCILDRFESDMEPQPTDLVYLVDEGIRSLTLVKTLITRYGNVVVKKAEFFQALRETAVAVTLIDEMFPVRAV